MLTTLIDVGITPTSMGLPSSRYCTVTPSVAFSSGMATTCRGVEVGDLGGVRVS